jgi:N-acetylglucosamine kinase-like BadF-type ATPase
MSENELLLAVDGGGSKTRALLADTTGNVIGRGTGGSSNYHVVGLEAAGRALQIAIDGARKAANGSDGRIVAACFGLASVDRPSDQLLINGWVSRQGLTDRFCIVNDSELVLAAGTPEGWGIALICGTGSICVGRSKDGRGARAGGWGYLMGDEGSGYFLGVQALRLATQTADGRADAQRILDMVLEQWELEHPEQLLSFVYQTEGNHGEIAALAERILDLAEDGDLHAQRLLDTAARALAQHVDTVARRLEIKEPPLALGGGLMASSERLRRAMHSNISISLGPVTVVEEPARGGLLIAQDLWRSSRSY